MTWFASNVATHNFEIEISKSVKYYQFPIGCMFSKPL